MICRKLKIHVLEHGSSVEPWLLCLLCGMLIYYEYTVICFPFYSYLYELAVYEQRQKSESSGEGIEVY